MDNAGGHIPLRRRGAAGASWFRTGRLLWDTFSAADDPLFVAGFVTLVAAACAAKSMSASNAAPAGAAAWAVHVAASGIAMASMWLSVYLHLNGNAAMCRDARKGALALAVLALLAVMAVGTVDPEMVFDLIHALL